MMTIGNMTIDELRQFIDEHLQERLSAILGDLAVDEGNLTSEADQRSWEDVKADIEKHRWIPPSGTPSVMELLREDRESE